MLCFAVLCIALLCAVKTGVDALDKAEETLRELNWVRVEEPPAGTSIRTNDGKRLWFPVTVRDCTGTLTLYIQEAAALSLSGCCDADQFEAAFEEGRVMVSAEKWMLLCFALRCLVLL